MERRLGLISDQQCLYEIIESEMKRQNQLKTESENTNKYFNGIFTFLKVSQ